MDNWNLSGGYVCLRVCVCVCKWIDIVFGLDEGQQDQNFVSE